MILLICNTSIAHKCAAALHQNLRTRVQVVESPRDAAALLREREFEAVVIDEALLETQAAAVDSALRHCGMAVPVFVNPAICGADRIAREAAAALQRRAHEQRAAYDAARKTLSSALKDEVTGILLNTELVLGGEEDLPEPVKAKLNLVRELASRAKAKL